jgi:5-methylcytosine-specific restriction endonuclease McrA
MAVTNRLLTLAQIADLDIRRPEAIQRSIDSERVASIVEYQNRRISAGLPLLFPGALILARSADSSSSSTSGVQDQVWLIDGQHRWSAMLILCRRAPEAQVLVQEFCLGVDSGLCLGELFRLVNQSVPVPEHLMDETLTDAHNELLRRFEELFRARYKAFIVRSQQPRRPNVNLDHLMATVNRNKARLLEDLPTAEDLMDYILWVNRRLLDRYVSTELRDKAVAKQAADPLVLTHDVDSCWATDRRWVDAYKRNSTLTTPPLEREPAARGPVTQAMRRALWRRDFGERSGVGKCAACGDEILLLNFEVGHVRAVAQGGSTVLENLVALCRPCNLGMGTSSLEEFKRLHF